MLYGFVILLAIVKLALKKAIPADKLMGIYIVVFLLGLIVVSAYGVLFLNVTVDLAATMGELIGFAIAFAIFDLIIIGIGKWVFYRKKSE